MTQAALKQAKDHRMLCQIHRLGHMLAGVRNQVWGTIIGLSAIAFAILAVFLEANSSGQPTGAAAAVAAAVLAIADVYLKFPVREEAHAIAARRYGKAERQIADLLNKISAASEADQALLLEQIEKYVSTAEVKAPLLRLKWTHKAEKEINAREKKAAALAQTRGSLPAPTQ